MGEVADLWRTTEDLLDIWQNGDTNSCPMGVGNVLDIDAPLAAQSGPGHWNDPTYASSAAPPVTD